MGPVKAVLLWLVLGFGAACFGQVQAPAVTPEPPRQSFDPRLSKSPQFIEGFLEIGAKAPKTGRGPISLESKPLAPSGTPCSHIRVIPAPTERDPKIVFRVPPSSTGTMPIHRGFPPCSEDLQ